MAWMLSELTHRQSNARTTVALQRIRILYGTYTKQMAEVYRPE